jgi:hypothetical protein
MPTQFAIGTPKKVPVIDKEYTQLVVGAFLKDSLPVVGVLGTNVNQPSQPEDT